MSRNARLITIFLVGISMYSSVHAQAWPTLDEGDTWRYRQLHEKLGAQPWALSTPDFALMFKNREGNLVFAIKPRNQGTPVWQPIGPISPSVCLFDVIAAKGVTDRCNAPLKAGQTWITDESTSIEKTEEIFTVGEVEDVVVPAGKYRGLKIQSRRTVTEVAFSGVPAPAGGYTKQFSTTWWYSSEVKAMVKVIREFPARADGLTRLTEELEFYSAGGRK